MTTATTTPATTEEGYQLCRALIYHQVHKFARTYGGDREELESQAHLAFVRGDAYYRAGKRQDGRPLKHPYHQEIRRWVWFELFDQMRAQASKNNRAAMQACGDAAYMLPDTSWCRAKFEEGLGEDALLVLGLVLDGPPELHDQAARKGGEPRNLRSCIRAYLAALPAQAVAVASKPGQTDIEWRRWTPARINAAFDQIRGEL